MPFVTLIIPIYNAERYLRRCLDSVMEVLPSAGNMKRKISGSG